MVKIYSKPKSEEANEKEINKKRNGEEIKNLLGDLNPRYFEEVVNLKKTKQRDWAKYAEYYYFRF